MGWYLMCRETNGDLNYKINYGSKQAAEKAIAAMEKHQTCTLVHTVEEFDNDKEKANG